MRFAFRTDGLQDVAAAGEADFVVDFERGVPFTAGAVEDETSVGLDRAAEINGLRDEFSGVELEFYALEKRTESHVERAVDDDAQRALGVVFGDVGEGPHKMRVDHLGHGDQKVVREVVRDGFHARYFTLPQEGARCVN